MKAKKIIGYIMQVPAWLLLVASIGAGIYAAYNEIQGITFDVPVIIGVVFILYVVGRILAGMKPKINQINQAQAPTWGLMENEHTN